MRDVESFLTEDELLNRLREGDAKAFEEIFNRYWKKMYLIAWRGLRSKEEAEELIQELFEKLWSKRETLRILNLPAYLSGATRKGVVDAIRSKLVHQKYWDYYQQYIPKSVLSDDALRYNELRTELEEALSHLPLKTQDVFRLNRFEGLPVAEIARDLKLSQRTIEYHLTKSLRLIRHHIKDFLLLLIINIYAMTLAMMASA